MFTGIVQATGPLVRITSSAIEVGIPGDLHRSLAVGGSIAVNGVCLTARDVGEQSFIADLSRETFSRTTFGALRAGLAANLELPLAADGEVGGHWVLGHVDAVGRVRSLFREKEAWTLVVSFPPAGHRYIADKGSIAVDGISLTPFDVREDSFRCAVIPETLERTSLRERRLDDVVNLEYDILAKYVERMMRDVRAH
jgi:riboflavin synthase